MKILLPIILFMLTACSSLPVSIKNAPEPELALAEVANNVKGFQGQQVRWGGQIIKVENSDQGATLHIAQFPLNNYGKPLTDEDSQGRFLAHSSEFIDPYVYKADSLVTVAGIISGQQTLTIEKKQLTAPVVNATQIYRWPPYRYVRDPYYYPYCGPGYPYYDRFGYGLNYPGWRSSWYYNHGFCW